MSLAGLFRKRPTASAATTRTTARIAPTFDRAKMAAHFRELDEAREAVDRRIEGELDVTSDEALKLLAAILAETLELRADIARLDFPHNGEDGGGPAPTTGPGLDYSTKGREGGFVDLQRSPLEPHTAT